jgi:hypothetical protein
MQNLTEGRSSVKVKGKVFHVHVIKAYSESRGIAPLILNLRTRWRYINFTPRQLYPPKKNAGAHRTGGWLGPRASLDVLNNKNKTSKYLGKRKFS